MVENNMNHKAFAFAVRIVKLRKYLVQQQKEYDISKQLLRSGTSIGANISEADFAQSRADFVAKLQVALKETAETEYWIRLLKTTEYLSEEMYQSIMTDCLELKKFSFLLLILQRKNKVGFCRGAKTYHSYSLFALH